MPIELPQGPGDARRDLKPSPDDPCFFCEIIAGREEKGIVDETDQTLAFVNWQQFELGQIYVIPRGHAPTLFDLTDDEASAIMHAVRRVAGALLKAYAPDVLNLIQNNGPPHIAVLDGKEPTNPSWDILVTLGEHEIPDEIGRHLHKILVR